MTQAPDRIELESKIAFLERTLEELNEVILDQGRSIEALERRLALLESRGSAETDAEGGPRDLADDRPPHY